MEGNNSSSGFLTVRNVIRIAAGICIIMFFCPFIAVKGWGESAGVSAAQLLAGSSDLVSDATFGAIFLLLLPVGLLVITFIKKLSDKIASIITAAAAGTGLLIWLIIGLGTKSAVEEYTLWLGISVSTTFWFWLTILMLLTITACGVMMLVKKMGMDTELVALFKGNASKE